MDAVGTETSPIVLDSEKLVSVEEKPVAMETVGTEASPIVLEPEKPVSVEEKPVAMETVGTEPSPIVLEPENLSVVEEEEVDEGFGRRVSSRNTGKKRPFYGSPKKPEKKKVQLKTSKTTKKRTKIDHMKVKEEKMKKNLGEVVDGEDTPTAAGEGNDIASGGEAKQNGGAAAEKDIPQYVDGEVMVDPSEPLDFGDKTAQTRVKETIRLFNKHYLSFIQEEELRCKKVQVSNANSEKSKKEKPGVEKEKPGVEDVKRAAKRPDLKAITKMMESDTILYPRKRFGHLPGVDVGYQFYSRAEMVVVGNHSHWLNGIDFMGNLYSKMQEYKGYTFPIAVSVVISGMYQDDEDNFDEVVYTGQGGNDLLGNKTQIKDQLLVRGNLALKNSMEQSVPVRVVRGHDCASSYCGKVYTYDGLYRITSYWAEKGTAGFTVYKYRLRRLKGQPPLTTNQVHFIRAQAPKIIAEVPGLVCSDISGGQERTPVPATNLVDDPPVGPTDYTYSQSIQVAEGLALPASGPGCKCKGTCTDPNICACAKLNGSDFPYVHKDGGRLVEAKSVVFECGPNCGCGPGCVNRTSQRGLRYRLEVFRTPSKGWAVRSWDFIPSGAPVCEYKGKLMRTSDIDSVSENDYIFEIDCLQTMKGLDGRETRPGVVSIPMIDSVDNADDKKMETAPEYCIDAGPIGNVARFINHSCEPNLFVQCVLSSHHDIKLARVMLFAADNISPMQELTYDYGYALDSVMGADGKIKVLQCRCGAVGCRKRLY